MVGPSANVMSVEIGVEDRNAADTMVSAMMQSASSPAGEEKEVAQDVAAIYLRIFEPPSSSSTPRMWVDFAIRYKSKESAAAIGEWLFSRLEDHREKIFLKIDTREADITKEGIAKVVGESIQQT